jgi:hypothetical protein
MVPIPTLGPETAANPAVNPAKIPKRPPGAIKVASHPTPPRRVSNNVLVILYDAVTLHAKVASENLLLLCDFFHLQKKLMLLCDFFLQKN